MFESPASNRSRTNLLVLICSIIIWSIKDLLAFSNGYYGLSLRLLTVPGRGSRRRKIAKKRIFYFPPDPVSPAEICSAWEVK